MTPIDRFLDELPVTLIDLADERMPDYVDDLLGQSAASGQRPAWTFPGRWIPMADLVAERRFIPQLPWRVLAVAALALLLIAGAVWFAGSRHRVPAPFGPAANGLIAYSKGGDIYTADAVTGQPTLVIGGSSADSSPLFSPNGERFAFLRQNAAHTFDLMVAKADGHGVLQVSTTPLVDGTTYQWSADSRSLYVPYPTAELARLDADGGPPVVIATGVDVDIHALRPPDGREILYQTHGDEHTLSVMNADGTNPHSIVPPGDVANFEQARWSPDGTRIVFSRAMDNPAQSRLFVMNADGSGLRPLSTDPRTLFEKEPVWSPDGTRVAFNRWLYASENNWVIQPIGIIDVATGAVVDAGSPPDSNGSAFDWSPDGTLLIGLPGPHVTYGSTVDDAPTVIDVGTGIERPLEWTVESVVSWQRAAP